MNNEEKKAIEYFKNKLNEFEKRLGTKITTEDNINIEIILNLIEKQQKEIEDKKEEIYTIAKTNYDVGMLEERSQWYKKIDKMIESYKKLDKEEFAKQGNFDTEISVLEELKRKEE